MKIYITIGVLFLLGACKTPKPVSELTEDDIVISLRKGGCFGECPVYTFHVYNGGHSEFIGQMNTKKVGTYTKQIEKDIYKNLMKSFKDSDFHQYDDFYESNIADLPLITMSYNDGKSTKTVKGKRERPTKLHRLQFDLEQIAESNEGWTLVSEEVKPEETGPQYIKTQIILKLKHGNQLAKWFNQMREEHGIRILKRLSEEDDSWLVSYDTKEYAPEKILEILSNDPNVESAEFNVEVQKQ